MRVIITAATVAEWMPCFLNINHLYTSESQRLKLQFHQSGIGMLAASHALTKLALEDKPDLIIQAGIAGCYDPSMALGTVVVIKDEIIGDLGVEEGVEEAVPAGGGQHARAPAFSAAGSGR